MRKMTSMEDLEGISTSRPTRRMDRIYLMEIRGLKLMEDLVKTMGLEVLVVSLCMMAHLRQVFSTHMLMVV